MWYPENKNELDKMLEGFLKERPNIKLPSNIHGLIVPHAGYVYSGAIAGKAYSLLKSKSIKKAIIVGPSHYFYANEPITHYSDKWFTPLGEIKILKNDFKKKDITKEHSIDNQVPFLQKLNVEQLLPLMIGDITIEQAKDIAEKLSKIPASYIFSTDLSHFLSYEDAKIIDKETIDIIESMDFNRLNKLDACGAYPLVILFQLCKILKTSPHLIEYKNSGDVTGDKDQVVGYASFYF